MAQPDWKRCRISHLLVSEQWRRLFGEHFSWSSGQTDRLSTRRRTQRRRGNFLQVWLCPDLCADKLGGKQSGRQDMRCELWAILDRKAGTSLKLAYPLWDKEVPLWTHISPRVWASLPRRRGAEKRLDVPGQRACPQLFHTRGFTSPLVRQIGFNTRHTTMLLGIPCRHS